jgi:hypothetical protein
MILLLASLFFLFLCKKALGASFEQSRDYLSLAREAAENSPKMAMGFSFFSFFIVCVYILSIVSAFKDNGILITKMVAFVLIGLKAISAVQEHSLVFDEKEYKRHHYFFGKLEQGAIAMLALYTIYISIQLEISS